MLMSMFRIIFHLVRAVPDLTLWFLRLMIVIVMGAFFLGVLYDNWLLMTVTALILIPLTSGMQR